jgi:hypothetical protein
MVSVHQGNQIPNAYPNKEELIKQNMQFNQASLSCIVTHYIILRVGGVAISH